MRNLDLTKYLNLQKNNRECGTKLDMLFIIIMYGVKSRPVQWFGDAIIDFDIATEPGIRDIHQFVLPAAPFIWVYLHVHKSPGFTGSGANHFYTLLECSESDAKNREVLNFQPDKPHISISILWQDESPSSDKMVQSTLGGVLKKKNLEKGQGK